MPALELRPAGPGDYALYVQCFAQLGLSDEPVASSRWERECAPTSAFLRASGSDVGYAFWEQNGSDAYVRHVVVDAASRGKGLGRALMRELASLLRGRGVRAWRLNVVTSNAVAIRLYRSLGFAPAHTTEVLRLPWSDASRLQRSPANVADSPARADEELERAFGLMRGQLALARGRESVRIVVARDPAGTAAGLAVFDPSYPGAFPFRSASPAHLGNLVEALRERYRGAQTYVQLVVEDDSGIAQALRSAGAEHRLEILHMRGPIPG